MAALKKFVKIKPISANSSVGINFNEFRKGINRTGMLTDGIGANFFEQKTLLQFQNDYLDTSTDKQIEVVEEEKKEKKKLFSDYKQRLRRMLGKKKRQKAEDAAEEGARDGDKEGKKRLEVIKKPIKSFLETIGKLLGNIVKYFIIFGALDWISKNPEKVQKLARLVFAIGKFGWWLGKWGIGNILNGITNLVGTFEDENAVQRGLRFLGGAFQLIGGIAALRAAQYLIMPWKMLTDFRRINSVFETTAETTEELKASRKARFKGYRDKKTGVIYSEKEYKEMQKSAKRADARRAKAAGKGYQSKLNQDAFNNRFNKQYEARKKGPFQKMQQRGRIAKNRMGRGMGRMVKKFPGGGAGILSVVGGGIRIAGGLAAGESAGTAVGAGVGQAVGGVAGAAALTAVAPFLGPLAPMIGGAIGSFLGEFVGKSIGPIIEPIFEPIGRYFGMLFDIVKDVFGPILDPFKELAGALFEFIGGIVGALMKVGKVLLDFAKFVLGPIFDSIGKVVGFVVNNAKRLMDPKSVVGGIADALTFNLFNFDKMAAGGPVATPQPPKMADGGPLGGQVSILREIGKFLLGAITGAIGAMGIFGGPVLSFMASDIAKLNGVFGGTTSVGGGQKVGGRKPSIPNIPENQTASKTVEKAVTTKKKLVDVYESKFIGVLKQVLIAAGQMEADDKKGNSGSSSSSSSSSSSGSSSSSSSSSGASVGSFSGDANSGSVQKKGTAIAKNFKNELGITKEAAAAIAGNFAHESAGFIPGIREGGPFGQNSKPWPKGTVGKGYGWAQWTNAAPGDRYDKFIKSYGSNYDKVPTNEDNWKFAVQEMKGPEPLSSEFKQMTDVSAAAVWFRKYWERAGVHHDGPRIDYAKTFLSQMAKGGVFKGEEKKRDIGTIEKETHTRKRKEERAAGGKIKAIYSTGPTGGDNIKHAMGKMHGYGDFAPHHRDPGGQKGYAGPTIGFQKDYNFSNQASGDPWPSSGIDVAIPTPLEGKILYRDPSSSSGGYGNTVVIKTAEGMMQFSHLHSLGDFKVGDNVKAGTIMGGQGDTGSEGAWHVHMNAPKALHEKFINYISMGKATSGTTSGNRSNNESDSNDESPGSESSGSTGDDGESKTKVTPMQQLEGAFDNLIKALGMIAGANVNVDSSILDAEVNTPTVEAEDIGPVESQTQNLEKNTSALTEKAHEKSVEEMQSGITPVFITETVTQPVINNVSSGKAFPVFSKPSPLIGSN